MEQNSADGDVNITDEEKEKLRTSCSGAEALASESNRPFLDTVLSAMDCTENDYLALLALSLVFALSNNEGKRLLRRWILPF